MEKKQGLSRLWLESTITAQSDRDRAFAFALFSKNSRASANLHLTIRTEEFSFKKHLDVFTS
jgi:hypothetical protein